MFSFWVSYHEINLPQELQDGVVFSPHPVSGVAGHPDYLRSFGTPSNVTAGPWVPDRQTCRRSFGAWCGRCGRWASPRRCLWQC